MYTIDNCSTRHAASSTYLLPDKENEAMLIGIIWAMLAGLMLGLYALPGKYTKDFQFENTWGLFFVLTMFVVPLVGTLLLIKDVGCVFSQMPAWKLAVMCVTSFAWGCGVMMWGKAITHIGMSLGFSLFIGTVILVGSILPIILGVMEKGLADGLPPMQALLPILVGIVIVLLGVISNGKAGLARQKDETAEKTKEEALDESPESEAQASMALVEDAFDGVCLLL